MRKEDGNMKKIRVSVQSKVRRVGKRVHVTTTVRTGNKTRTTSKTF